MTEKELKNKTAKLILDFVNRTAMHHGIWFAEVQRQFGREKAFEIINEVNKMSYQVQLKRISKILEFDISDDGIPDEFLKIPQQKLEDVRDACAANWLANDGIWFQAVENKYGMYDAKRCNDSAWGQFSPFEALTIKSLLDLPEEPGLEGLKKALNYRLYAYINEQAICQEDANSFVFKMIDCRVQSARKRKGLNDYPCKSAGIVEYRTFAETIDKRIKTECIACPPDEHPDDWYCAWKFYY